MVGYRESKNGREGLCILKGITVIKVTELADLISLLIQVAKPSLSQSWSHQATDTRFPNHWWAISWHTRIATYCFLQGEKTFDKDFCTVFHYNYRAFKHSAPRSDRRSTANCLTMKVYCGDRFKPESQFLQETSGVNGSSEQT